MKAQKPLCSIIYCKTEVAGPVYSVAGRNPTRPARQFWVCEAHEDLTLKFILASLKEVEPQRPALCDVCEECEVSHSLLHGPDKLADLCDSCHATVTLKELVAKMKEKRAA